MKNKKPNKNYIYNKYMYEENLELPIFYGDDYIDIYPDEHVTDYIILNMEAWDEAFNVMLTYLKYYNGIKNNPIDSNLYDKLYFKVMSKAYDKNINLSNTIYENICKYIRNPRVINNVIILAFKNAQSLYLEYPKTVKYSKSPKTFTTLATGLKDVKSNEIYIANLGSIKTSDVNPDIYLDKVTIKISKAVGDDGFIMELGRLSSNNFKTKKFHEDDLAEIKVDEYGNEVYVCKEIIL